MWYDQYCNNDIELLPNPIVHVYTHVHVPIFLQFLCDRLNKVYQQSLIAIEENIDTGNTIQDSTAIRLGLKKLRKYINAHCMITRWEQVYSVFLAYKTPKIKKFTYCRCSTHVYMDCCVTNTLIDTLLQFTKDYIHVHVHV